MGNYTLLRITQYVYTALCMTMILDSKKLNQQYNQNSVLTMPWIAWGWSRNPPWLRACCVEAYRL